jgi:hypothetical protein
LRRYHSSMDLKKGRGQPCVYGEEHSVQMKSSEQRPEGQQEGQCN